MNKNAVVTGAGSGVGQAVALLLVKQGWRVAIVGRRAEALQETVERAGAERDRLFVFACDIGKSDAVVALGREVLAKFGTVEAVVNAAGTNAPKRALEVLSLADYHAMIDTNLNGAYYITQAFLPAMRAQKSGTMVHVVSDAGKQASPKAGPAYVMGKFGWRVLRKASTRRNAAMACAHARFFRETSTRHCWTSVHHRHQPRRGRR